MNQFIKADAWNIIEEGYHPDLNEKVETVFTLGNGRMGHRGFFEEHYSGHSYTGNYLSGIYFLRKLPAHQGKKGLPEQWTKILNAPNWVGIDIHIDGEMLDLNTCKIKDFQRVLNLREGYLERSFSAKMLSGKELKVKATRFCSLDKKEVGVVRYAIKALNFEGAITFTPYLDGDVANKEDNWDGPYWTETDNQVKNRSCFLTTESKQTAFRVCTGMKVAVYKNKQEVKIQTTQQQEDKYAACTVEVRSKQNDEVVLYKYAAVVSTLHHEKGKLLDRCQELVRKAYKKGFEKLLKKQSSAWAAIWDKADVAVEGDLEAQQALRFGIFQLYQSFDPANAKCSLAPGGFSGERLSGNIQWDTELMAIPFFLATSDSKEAKNMLLYRCQQLPKAIENAEKQGFKNGAALFPASTSNGQESHPDWEIALGGVHRNAAIVYAIKEYLDWTGDWPLMMEHGLSEVVAVARFWAQRVHWSEAKQQYVIHGTVGPNEYEANVNNNWYTNFMAVWCLKQALETIKSAADFDKEKYDSLLKSLHFDAEKEPKSWQHIIDNMYLPLDEKRGIFLQQEGYLDKEPTPQLLDHLKKEKKPLKLDWPWDKILRSDLIQGPDVLLGIYLFPHSFSKQQQQDNFNFYEARTLHENSNSASIHAILSARLGMMDKAWAYFQQSLRLDLNDTFGDAEEGLHLLNFAGNYLAMTRGFGGIKVEEGQLSLSPQRPSAVAAFSFKLQWQGKSLEIKISQDLVSILNQSDEMVQLKLYGEMLEIAGKSEKKTTIRT